METIGKLFDITFAKMNGIHLLMEPFMKTIHREGGYVFKQWRGCIFVFPDKDVTP